MTGIVTLLSNRNKGLVESIWQELKVDCGLTGIEISPAPHFSWQVADDYDFTRLRPILLEMAANSETFRVKTAGLGIFSGGKPVLYLALVKDARLLSFHEMVWRAGSEAGSGINPLYAPQHWMPHITLAYDDLDRSNLACVMERLVFRQFEFEILVDNLCTVNQPEGQAPQFDVYAIGGSGEFLKQ